MEWLSGKMTSKGQVTIPKELRDTLQISEGDKIKFILAENSIKVVPIKGRKLSEVAGMINVERVVPIDEAREMYRKEFVSEFLAKEKGQKYE